MPRGGRNVPGLQQRFALKGKLLVKKYRGQLVVQKWPKPYGKARSQKQLDTQTAFKRFQRAVKFFPPQQIITAMELTKGTGMYPRDLMMAASLGTNVMIGYDELGATPMIGDGLEKFVAAGGETTIEFQNIPPGYSSLSLLISARSLKAATTETLRITCNGDAGAKYTYWTQNFFGYTDLYNQPSAEIGDINAASSPANFPSQIEVSLANYASSTFYKSYLSRGDVIVASSGASQFMNFRGGWYADKTPISRITITAPTGFAAGSAATLYGLF